MEVGLIRKWGRSWCMLCCPVSLFRLTPPLSLGCRSGSLREQLGYSLCSLDLRRLGLCLNTIMKEVQVGNSFIHLLQ